MQRCKNCGKEYPSTTTMTYAVYGYCSWECLMNKKPRGANQNRQNRRNNVHRNEAGNRSSKWA